MDTELKSKTRFQKKFPFILSRSGHVWRQGLKKVVIIAKNNLF